MSLGSWSCCSSFAISAFICCIASLQTFSFSFNSLISFPIFCRAAPIDEVVLFSISSPTIKIQFHALWKRKLQLNSVHSLCGCCFVAAFLLAQMFMAVFQPIKRKAKPRCLIFPRFILVAHIFLELWLVYFFSVYWRDPHSKFWDDKVMKFQVSLYRQTSGWCLTLNLENEPIVS